MGGSAAEFQCGLGSDGFDICDAANAVGSEKFAIVAHFGDVVFRLLKLCGGGLQEIKSDGIPTDVLLDEKPKGEGQKKACEFDFPIVEKDRFHTFRLKEAG